MSLASAPEGPRCLATRASRSPEVAREAAHEGFSCRVVRTALLLLGLLCASLPLAGQETGGIAGVVVSTWDGTPVTDAAITVRGTTLGTKTDATGRYELKSVPPGEQALRFSKSGFAAALVTDVRVVPGQVTTVNGNIRQIGRAHV